MRNAMLAWSRIPDGWALNLDGSDASRSFSLPRLELHAGPGGWTAVCHLPDGTSRPASVGTPRTLLDAKRAAVDDARQALGPPWDDALGALL
jgi:hypothetical protein